MGIWVFFVVAAVIVVAAIYVETQRRTALDQVASRLGFSFTGGQQALPDHLDRAGFYLFTQGQPLIKNRMDGERAGYQISVFGFGYDAGQGEEGSRALPTADDGQIERRLQTVVWLQRPGQTLPVFDLSPTRQPLRRLDARLGLQTVGLDGAQDFRDHYLLLGRDATALRRVFTPAVVDAWAADPGWFVEGRGDQWLVYRLQHRAAPADIPAFLDRAIGLIERLAHR
jgi:hypothetical protein